MKYHHLTTFQWRRATRFSRARVGAYLCKPDEKLAPIMRPLREVSDKAEYSAAQWERMRPLRKMDDKAKYESTRWARFCPRRYAAATANSARPRRANSARPPRNRLPSAALLVLFAAAARAWIVAADLHIRPIGIAEHRFAGRRSVQRRWRPTVIVPARKVVNQGK